jgi:Type II secretion system (T2SS), protein N
MPVSRSPRRDSRPDGRDLKVAQGSRSHWPLILIGLIVVLTVTIAVLPASIITHFLPKAVHAEDFSGSIWHGSAGKLSVNERDAGALEWWLHPRALLGMSVDADLHWVKVGFVIDAAVNLDRRGLTAHDIRGSGPIADLRDFGVAPGWRGSAYVNLRDLHTDYVKPLAIVGDVKVSNLASAQVANGAELGSYDLVFPEGAVGAEGNVDAQLIDTGGPLEAQAVVHYSPKDFTATLSGTVKERSEVSPALRSQLQDLSQMRGRDSQGRIPVDLEFRF